MDFPVELKSTHHRMGGRIVRVHGIGHEAWKPREGRSQDIWHFIGDVEWRDGGKSELIEIAAYAVCYTDEAERAEVDALMEALNDYLCEHGDWYRGKSKHEGWYANDRSGEKRRRA